MKRKIKSLLMVLIILVALISPSNVNAADSNFDIQMPLDAEQFAKDRYLDVIDIFEKYADNISFIGESNYSLGAPFVIYDLDTEYQTERYYFPVLDEKDEVILMIIINGTTVGWGLTASEEMVDELNQIAYEEEDYIFYESDDIIIAENDVKITNFSNEKNEKCLQFEKKEFREKQKIVSEEINSSQKTDVTDTGSKDIVDGYTPAYSTSTSSIKICSLYNKQAQGSYPLCWACTVATIANYRNGTNLTMFDVCDDMGYDYNQGRTIGEAQVALYNYISDYNLLNWSQLSFAGVKTNINYKRPIYLSSYCAALDSGHAVTIYGYEDFSSSDYIVIWNSGTSGTGSTQVVTYNSSGTTFSYSNNTFTWRYSLSWTQ